MRQFLSVEPKTVSKNVTPIRTPSIHRSMDQLVSWTHRRSNSDTHRAERRSSDCFLGNLRRCSWCRSVEDHKLYGSPVPRKSRTERWSSSSTASHPSQRELPWRCRLVVLHSTLLLVETCPKTYSTLVAFGHFCPPQLGIVLLSRYLLGRGHEGGWQWHTHSKPELWAVDGR